MKYEFCHFCGFKLVKSSSSLFICKNCSRNIYLSPKPTSSLILKNPQGEVLLAKRKFPPKKGYWDIPGGFMDIEETAEQGLKREAKEELGVDLTNIKYFGSYPDRYLYQGINYYLLNIFFTADVDIGKLQADDDISEFAFFAPQKFPYQKIAFESITKALKDLTG